eukprot:6205630-Pleurochrysis_carterae.AAC.2
MVRVVGWCLKGGKSEAPVGERRDSAKRRRCCESKTAQGAGLREWHIFTCNKMLLSFFNLRDK